MANSPAHAVRKAFYDMVFGGDDGVAPAVADRRSNKLRSWYNKGQQAFRHALSSVAGLEPTPAQLNELLEMIDNETEREGFLMGWQSDAYAYENGLELSVLGGQRQEIENVKFAWQD